MASFGWVVIYPLAVLIPKKKNRITVIGRYGGEFADNTKYFFLQCANSYSNIEIIFLTEKREVFLALKNKRKKSVFFPTPRSIYYLATSAIIVVDNNQWRSKYKFFIAKGAKIIQLWHGVGFKRIENSKIYHESNQMPWLKNKKIIRLREISRKYSGRRIIYDLVVCTSKFYRDNVFIESITSKNYLVCGYPRNSFDYLIRDPGSLIGVDAEMLENITRWKRCGYKIILATPTFRDSKKPAIQLSKEDVSKIDKTLSVKGAKLILKLHPHDQSGNSVKGENIHHICNESDIYPILPLVDCLITDYSSIYMDFILLDKPVYFYVPDFDDYVSNERQIQFDYHEMTPGPKVKTWEEIVTHLLDKKIEEKWGAERERIKKLAFDDHDQHKATQKIVEFAIKKGWLINEL